MSVNIIGDLLQFLRNAVGLPRKKPHIHRQQNMKISVIPAIGHRIRVGLTQLPKQRHNDSGINLGRDPVGLGKTDETKQLLRL